MMEGRIVLFEKEKETYLGLLKEE